MAVFYVYDSGSVGKLQADTKLNSQHKGLANMKMNFNEKQSFFFIHLYKYQYKYVGLHQQINGCGFALNQQSCELDWNFSNKPGDGSTKMMTYWDTTNSVWDTVGLQLWPEIRVIST